MALAPLAHVLWTRVMRHDPSDPSWPDRDRFVLSNGHASILLYSMLYLTGYDLSLDDLRASASGASRPRATPSAATPPGWRSPPAPWARGSANAVGMGVAERFLRARFGPELVDHHTFVFAGDGCFEEGISHEAASLAGHLGLGRLVYVYDDNHISIDGPTELAYTDNVPERFAAYGWDVDTWARWPTTPTPWRRRCAGPWPSRTGRRSSCCAATSAGPRPTSPTPPRPTGTPSAPEEIRATKEILGLPPDETFWVPDEVARALPLAASEGPGAAQRVGGAVRRLGRRPAAWDAAWAGRASRGWAAKLPTLRGRGEQSPPARPSTPASTPPPTSSRGWWPARPT